MTDKNEIKLKVWNFKENLYRYASFIQHPYGTGEYFAPYEVLNAELEVVKNSLFWDYEFSKLNTDDKKVKAVKDTHLLANFFNFVEENSEPNVKKEKTQLKDKMFISNARVGERLHRFLSVDLDFLSTGYRDYRFIYFVNFELGRVCGNGNHRMFAQTIKGNSNYAFVENYNELEFLHNFVTDGYCIYKKDKPKINFCVKNDERIPLLFFLTQIKVGVIPINSVVEYIKENFSTDLPYLD